MNMDKVLSRYKIRVKRSQRAVERVKTDLNALVQVSYGAIFIDLRNILYHFDRRSAGEVKALACCLPDSTKSFTHRPVFCPSEHLDDH
jgi:hypothetical protein